MSQTVNNTNSVVFSPMNLYLWLGFGIAAATVTKVGQPKRPHETYFIHTCEQRPKKISVFDCPGCISDLCFELQMAASLQNIFQLLYVTLQLLPGNHTGQTPCARDTSKTQSCDTNKIRNPAISAMMDDPRAFPPRVQNQQTKPSVRFRMVCIVRLKGESRWADKRSSICVFFTWASGSKKSWKGT